MFEWCSISVMSTSSPSPTCSRPHAYATRLIASVALRVKIEHGRVPVHERGDPLAGPLERVGGLARQLVDAAVDRRVGLALEAVHRLDHLLRPLRGGGRVEVGHPLAVELAPEHGEVGADVDERLVGDVRHSARLRALPDELAHLVLGAAPASPRSAGARAPRARGRRAAARPPRSSPRPARAPPRRARCRGSSCRRSAPGRARRRCRRATPSRCPPRRSATGSRRPSPSARAASVRLEVGVHLGRLRDDVDQALVRRARVAGERALPDRVAGGVRRPRACRS